MNVRWLTTRAPNLLLVLSIYPGSTLPQHRAFEASETRSPLRFGQSIALSDFDADGLVDEARLDSSGSEKGVKLPLSRTGKLLVLHFDDAIPGQLGSLIAQDVDNDGATDLVYTDLLHADDVIVWLGNGAGQFERVSAKVYGDRFTLGHKNVDAPEGSGHETAINSETNRPLDQSPVYKCICHNAAGLSNVHVDRIADFSPALGQPPGRSPPSRLS
jgi:hypothetical protein